MWEFHWPKLRRSRRSGRPSLPLAFSLLLISIGVDLCFGLNSEQRSELARKFKYYHVSVRPADRFNLLETINGTFFALHAEVELLTTNPVDGRLEVELALNLFFHDDRLLLRDLDDVITLPDEFEPWRPTLEFPDHTRLRISTHLDPQSGQISVRYKIRVDLSCRSLLWTRPFQKYTCRLSVLTSDGERLFLKLMRDLRNEFEVEEIHCHVGEFFPSLVRPLTSFCSEQWPFFFLECAFRNVWLSAIVKVYVPAVLIFVLCVFAQWKRRKMQILVTLGALLGLLLIQTANDLGTAFTMQDLWLIGTFMHLVCLLSIDLILPARRLIRTTYTTLNGSGESTGVLERRMKEKTPYLTTTTTTSYKEVLRRLLQPSTLSTATTRRAYSGSSEEPAAYGELPHRLPPAHHDLLDIEMADEDEEEDGDLERMRTTVVQHVHRPPNRSPSAKPQPIGSSLSASATTFGTSPSGGSGTTAAIIRRSQVAPTATPVRSQQFVSRWSIGRKKRAALIAIVGCYALFVFVYLLLAVYILN
ncbi:hypothetical protein M3Y99_00776800 [Aphelenchoides fujianensis]|nr:hypothetical protein M3Y99_00776800 [Aphelenchoides fujianensis]